MEHVRRSDEMRPVKMTPDFTEMAAGSVLIECGRTRVLCTASVVESVPPFKKGTGCGWLTAEYAMLPGSTERRKERDGIKKDGRGVEIQRLIGRSLRAACDLTRLGERTIYIDCDVLQADGGTRTASITGAFAALTLACDKLMKRGLIVDSPVVRQVAAVSVGIVDNAKLVDGSGIRVGDKIVGLASTGLHSNGFSLARKILDKSGLGPDDPFPGAGGATVRDVLLAPTQIYVEVVRSLLRDLDVRGMAHITGGGFYDNIPRVLPNQVEAHIDFGSWEMPPVFKWLHEVGELSWPEILQIFNGGIGYVLVLPEEQVEETINRIQAFGMSAWSIGTIARRNGDGEQVVVNFDKA